ncbi:MAG: sulfatase [Planctomycetota bacterium]
MRLALALCGLTLGASSVMPATPAVAEPAERPNILFLGIDDLRPDLGAYGHDLIHSPNLDAIANDGLLFQRAYCQAALCAPSRSSLMSGLRPGIVGINATDSRDKKVINRAVDAALTLPEHLRANGYTTLSVGKIFHTYDTSGSGAWDKQLRPGGGHYQLESNRDKERIHQQKVREEGRKARWKYPRGDAAEAADVPDDRYQTHRIATRGIKLMREHVQQNPDEPFFLAVGWHKPHLPFIAPQKYWDLYDRDAIEVPSRAEPEGVPEYSLVPAWYEMRQYGDVPRDRKQDLNDKKTKEFIHGYYACISFVDAQVGRIMEELEAQGLADNTIVIVWSDHGFKLGDYGDWSKYTNMEIDTRVPLLVSGPGVVQGKQTDALVELIDLYPTVIELAGVSTPEHVEATSFVPLLSSPETPWKSGALSYYDRRNPDAEGFSLRDERFRYTEWRDYETGDVLARELYDHAETTIADRNLATDPAYADHVDRLAAMLAAGWESLVPSTAASSASSR